MPARIRKIRHDEETRAKIQTSQLVNRLTNHVLGDVDLSATQVTAALGLLRKTLPDLSAAELDIGPQERRVVNAEPMTDDEWTKRYTDDLGTAAGASESTH